MSALRAFLVASALLLALVVPFGTASAATGTECSAQIGTLREAVAGSSLNDKDLRASDNKLLTAQDKLVDGKNADAIAKLVDFRTKIEQLSAAGKLGAADADALIAGANGAIACIESIPATA